MYQTPCPSVDQRCDAPSEYYTANSQVPDKSDFESNFVVLTMNWSTDFGDITSITAYKDFSLKEFTDQDFSPVYGSSTYRPTEGEQFSQELRGTFDISDRFRLQAGGFYMDTSYNHLQNYNQHMFAAGYREETYNDGDNSSVSVFGQAYFDLSDRLRLQAGLRYTHEETELGVRLLNFIYLDENGIPAANPAPGFTADVALGTLADVKEKESWSEVGGKLGLDYRMSDDMMVYGFYARGFKSGGYVGRIRTPAEIGPYDPEYVDSFELGLKSELADNSVRLNLAAFVNKYKDQQIASIRRDIDPVSGINVNVNTILNAAKSTIWGFEAELQALIGESLTLQAALGYLNAEYDDFVYPLPAGGVVDMSGEVLQNAPEWGGNVSATYETSVGSGNLLATLQYRYSDSKYYTNILNTPRSYIQATHFVDANIDWMPASEEWAVSLWARNLADERYVSVAYDSPGYAALVGYYPPREYGVTLKFFF